MISSLLSALQQTLLFLPLCFGIYVTYRIMDMTDLTVEGTFVLGAAVFARLITQHVPELLASIIAISAGGLIGLLVALIQKYAKLDALITSILAIFMLHSINFAVMGQPNISLISSNTLIQTLQTAHANLLVGGLCIAMLLLAGVLCLFLQTQRGLLLRAFGDNPLIIKHLRHSQLALLILGLVLSNSLAALSGIITCQINGYADINMGLGVALTAIGSMIIGITLVKHYRGSQKRFNSYLELIGCVFGVYLYFIAMNLLLMFGVNPIYIKLLLGFILLFFLASSQLHRKEIQYA